MLRAALLFASALLLAGAARAQNAVPAGGEATIALAGEPQTLDPTRYTSGVDVLYFEQIFEQLIRTDADGKPVNWLAESWALTGSADRPVIDVRLRRDVTFQNGYPLTAADWKFSYERLRDPKLSRWAFRQAAVETFEIVDDYHFKLHLREGDASYISENLTLWAMSKRYFDEVGEETFSKQPIGTGPWKLVGRRIGEGAEFEANRNYWNERDRPSLGRLTVKVIPDDATRLAAFVTGAVDWIDSVPLQSLASLASTPGVKVLFRPSGQHMRLNFNTHMPDSPFRDARVREAVAVAIDVPAILKSVLFGKGERLAELAPGDLGFDPSIAPRPFDPRKARDLLQQAGFPRGFETPCYNLVTPREPNLKEVGEAIFAYLGAVGIRCRVRSLDSAAWINLGRRGRNAPPEMDGLIIWTWAYLAVPGDPTRDLFGSLHSFVPGTGFGTYSYTSEPDLDGLIEAQNRIMDRERREAAIRDIMRLKHERLVGGIPTYMPVTAFAWRSDKVDYTPWPWSWRNMIGLRAAR